MGPPPPPPPLLPPPDEPLLGAGADGAELTGGADPALELELLLEELEPLETTGGDFISGKFWLTSGGVIAGVSAAAEADPPVGADAGVGGDEDDSDPSPPLERPISSASTKTATPIAARTIATLRLIGAGREAGVPAAVTLGMS
jgi:hypothetical protein